MTVVLRILVLAGLSITAATIPACRPDFGDRDSLITRAQVLAVRGEPPEVPPGEGVTYTLLVATPSGPMAAPLANWAFCASAKAPTENGAASASCLSDAVGSTRPIAADGLSELQVALPIDVCSVFGPEIKSEELRPRDPDITGGFYQPMRVTVFDTSTTPESTLVAFGLERVKCKLANAPADTVTEFAKRYRVNVNPVLAPLTIIDGNGGNVPPTNIPRGAAITLRASWTPESAEPYVVFDVVSRTLVEKRETMRVSWFATAGSFESDRTGRAGEEPETFTDNVWTAPNEARTTHLFIVLRDDRGGVVFATQELVTR